MVRFRRLLLLSFAGILIILAACSKQKKRPVSQQQQPSWSASFDSLREQYRSLHMAYAQDSTRMPKQVQQMYGHMRNLWGSMVGLHSGMMEMMGGGRMKNGRGMMGRMNNGHGMMGLGKQPGQSMLRFQEMSQQMVSYCQGMQQMMTQAGDSQMAARYGRMMNQAQHMMSQIPTDTISTSAPPEKSVTGLNGASLFASNCSSCHGSNGEGFGNVFPPLNGSSIVKGDKETLTKIVLDGLQGNITIKGNQYNNIMPAFRSSLNNDEIAAILTYIRSLSQNDVSKLTPEDIQNVRQSTSGHRKPWTSGELGLQ